MLKFVSHLSYEIYPPPPRPHQETSPVPELFDGLDIQHSLFLIDVERQSAAYGTEELLFHYNIIIENVIVFS